jgi:DNA repair protein RecO (recombination protein O)
MAVVNRVPDEPAYVLHRYDWSESSLIVEAWSRHHGRVALVAKGAKKPSSQLRPVLLPLQALHLSWWGDAEIRTLKSAQWAGGAVMPQGDALLAGLYLNELLLRMLARDDPHPALFDVYAQAVVGLSQPDGRLGVLRATELHLLRALGVLPSLRAHGTTHKPLEAGRAFRLQAELGLQTSQAGGLDGAIWSALELGLADLASWPALVALCVQHEAALRGQLRAVLQYHSGLSAFRSRQLWVDVAAVSQRASMANAARPS